MIVDAPDALWGDYFYFYLFIFFPLTCWTELAAVSRREHRRNFSRWEAKSRRQIGESRRAWLDINDDNNNSDGDDDDEEEEEVDDDDDATPWCDTSQHIPKLTRRQNFNPDSWQESKLNLQIACTTDQNTLGISSLANPRLSRARVSDSIAEGETGSASPCSPDVPHVPSSPISLHTRCAPGTQTCCCCCWSCCCCCCFWYLLADVREKEQRNDLVFIWSHILRNCSPCVAANNREFMFWELDGTFPSLTVASLLFIRGRGRTEALLLLSFCFALLCCELS